MTDAILREFKPADLDWLVDRHRIHYARDEGFDDTFGDLVANVLADFVADHDPAFERGWIAEAEGTRLGSIFCVRQSNTTAKLRLFLLMPEARGQGLGRRMLTHCTEYARAAGYRDMKLWTHESHRAACGLYAATGWALGHSRVAHSFGQHVIEQTWTRRL